MMGNVFDVFRGNAFGLDAMIARVDSQDFLPGQILSLGIIEEDSVNVPSALFEERDTVLTIVQTSQRGGPGKTVTDTPRRARSIKIPHLKVVDHIPADEVSGVREYGTVDQLQTVESVLNRRLQLVTRNFDGTYEHMAATMIQGRVLDADGSVLLDCYDFFEVAEPTAYNFAFGSHDDDGFIMATCRQIIRDIRTDAKTGNMVPLRIHGMAGPTFMDALKKSSETRHAYQQFNQNAMAAAIGRYVVDPQNAGDPPFYYGGIWFEEYRGGFIPDDVCRFFPVYAPGTGIYRTIFAPATYVETVNTLGRPRYAKIAVDDDFQEYVDLQVQSNPLVICTRPLALKKGTIS